MKKTYLETIALVERLHRNFLEVVKLEIDKLGVRDINNVQALILYNIGREEMTVGELTLRGCYLGSNVSYNLKKLIEQGYIAQARSPHDRRTIRIKLTETGLALHGKLDAIFDEHASSLGRIAPSVNLGEVCEALRGVDRFWGLQRP
ncbi:MAG: winged helix DNA-binding protein [Rhodospirillales bacterium]|jgi:DNA-binding MarR family transcriptional regulator